MLTRMEGAASQVLTESVPVTLALFGRYIYEYVVTHVCRQQEPGKLSQQVLANDDQLA